jgi:hypothetical protein
MAVWVVRAGYEGNEEPIALENSLVTIHWNELADLSAIANKDELEEMYRKANAKESAHVVAANVSQVSAFRFDIQKGALVILPLERMWKWKVAIGEVTGAYRFRKDLGKEVRHTLPVEWLIADLSRNSLESDLSDAIGHPKTVYQIKTPADAEERFRAILCEEIERRQRRILKNYPPFQANITHKDITHFVRLHTLPRAGELLWLCPKGSTGPICYFVESVIHRIEGETCSHTIEIPVREVSAEGDKRWTASELRKLSPEQRDAILEAAAIRAEEDYRNDRELTAFEAFGKDDLYGDSASTQTR